MRLRGYLGVVFKPIVVGFTSSLQRRVKLNSVKHKSCSFFSGQITNDITKHAPTGIAPVNIFISNTSSTIENDF